MYFLVLCFTLCLSATTLANEVGVENDDGHLVLRPAEGRYVLLNGELYVNGLEVATQADMSRFEALAARLAVLESIVASCSCPTIDTIMGSKTFTTTWDTTKTSSGSSGSSQIRLPLESTGTYNFTVSWDDGTQDRITAYDDAAVTHTYAQVGIYTIRIEGTIEGFRFNNGGDRLKLFAVLRWATLRLGNGGSYFWGAENMEILATDSPDLTGTTNMYRAFSKSGVGVTGNFNAWDTSSVTNMEFMFQFATAFNQDLSSWCVNNIPTKPTDFDSSASQWSLPRPVWGTCQSPETTTAAPSWAMTFNTTWDTTKTSAGSSNSTQIRLPLEETGVYDFHVSWGDGTQDHITTFNDTAVTHTYGQGGIYTVVIAGTIAGWRFANGGDKNKLLTVLQWGSFRVGSGGALFDGASNMELLATDFPDLTNTTTLRRAFFNTKIGVSGNLNAWDVSKITDMTSMFGSASLFNQPLISWNTSLVTRMSSMFWAASNFNQPLNSWDTSSVLDMSQMFQLASSFNQPLFNWDTSKVSGMNYMLQSASLFNQDLSSWCVTHIASTPTGFDTSTFRWSLPRPVWGTCP